MYIAIMISGSILLGVGVIAAVLENVGNELRKLRKSYDEERNRNLDRYLAGKVIKRPVGTPKDLEEE